jgi:hypothetical protein
LHIDRSNVALQEPRGESLPMVSWPVALLWLQWGNVWLHGQGDSGGDFNACADAAQQMNRPKSLSGTR